MMTSTAATAERKDPFLSHQTATTTDDVDMVNRTDAATPTSPSPSQLQQQRPRLRLRLQEELMEKKPAAAPVFHFNSDPKTSVTTLTPAASPRTPKTPSASIAALSLVSPGGPPPPRTHQWARTPPARHDHGHQQHIPPASARRGAAEESVATNGAATMLTASAPKFTGKEKPFENGCIMWVHLQASICTEWEQNSMVLTPGSQMGARVTTPFDKATAHHHTNNQAKKMGLSGPPPLHHGSRGTNANSILELLTGSDPLYPNRSQGHPLNGQGSDHHSGNVTNGTHVQKKPKTIHRCILQRVSRAKGQAPSLRCHVCDASYDSYQKYYDHLLDSTCAKRKEAKEKLAASVNSAPPVITLETPPDFPLPGHRSLSVAGSQRPQAAPAGRRPRTSGGGPISTPRQIQRSRPQPPPQMRFDRANGRGQEARTAPPLEGKSQRFFPRDVASAELHSRRVVENGHPAHAQQNYKHPRHHYEAEIQSAPPHGRPVFNGISPQISPPSALSRKRIASESGVASMPVIVDLQAEERVDATAPSSFSPKIVKTVGGVGSPSSFAKEDSNHDRQKSEEDMVPLNLSLGSTGSGSGNEGSSSAGKSNGEGSSASATEAEVIEVDNDDSDEVFAPNPQKRKCHHEEATTLPPISLVEHAADQATLARLKEGLTGLLDALLGEERLSEMGYPDTDILQLLRSVLEAAQSPVASADDACGDQCLGVEMASGESGPGGKQLRFRRVRSEMAAGIKNARALLEICVPDKAAWRDNGWDRLDVEVVLREVQEKGFVKRKDQK